MHRTVDQRRQATDEAYTAMQRALERTLDARRHALLRERERLLAYNPQKTLERGFALVARQGEIISSAAMLAIGDAVTVRFRDGAVDAAINGKEQV
jgi:exodeoxyribonuclease VII large subunit